MPVRTTYTHQSSVKYKRSTCISSLLLYYETKKFQHFIIVNVSSYTGERVFAIHVCVLYSLLFCFSYILPVTRISVSIHDFENKAIILIMM